MKNTLVLAFSVLLLFSSCSTDPSMKITIERQILLKVPSASGIENIHGEYWVVGDNSPWLYRLNDAWEIDHKFLIFDDYVLEQGVIPKAVKHDFEAMTSMEWDGDSVLFLFGSGSKSPQRNAGRLIRLSEIPQVTSFDLTAFYEMLKEEANLDEEDLNIEAAAVLNNRLYLFNRGKSKLIHMKVSAFQEYIQGKRTDLKMKVITVELPNLDGVKAGFSGASSDEANNRLIFTASVENTSNWIDDGAVLGSYVGILDESMIEHHSSPECTLITENGEPLKLKVESITIKTTSPEKLDCILVTDSDGGVSELLEIELTMK